jgi:hypothetical protein
MKKQVLTSIAIVLTTFCFAQTDTIYFNNEKIVCSVREITPEAVKYTYPSEDVLNSMYKNSVQKIVYKSGRVQTFAESTSFKKINDVDDFENVAITQVESEIKGLFKLGDVGSKAKGTTTLANQERVKERAYRKMKIVAAMMGANIVYLTDQRTEGNKQGGQYQSGSSAEANLSGVAYTNELPSFDEFKKLIKDKKNFSSVQETELWSGASDMTKTSIQRLFIIHSISNENGLIMINGELHNKTKNNTFRVVSFNQEGFNIYYKDKRNATSYNIKVKMY